MIYSAGCECSTGLPDGIPENTIDITERTDIWSEVASDAANLASGYPKTWEEGGWKYDKDTGDVDFPYVQINMLNTINHFYPSTTIAKIHVIYKITVTTNAYTNNWQGQIAPLLAPGFPHETENVTLQTTDTGEFTMSLAADVSSHNTGSFSLNVRLQNGNAFTRFSQFKILFIGFEPQ